MNQPLKNSIPVIIDHDKILATGSNAIKLFNRGNYGIPDKEGVILNQFEAMYLHELKRIHIIHDEKELGENDLLRLFSNKISNFLLRYIVYKDLRNRGYVVNIGKGSTFFFRLYDRESKPTKDTAKYYIIPLQEGGSIPLDGLEDLILISTKSRKKLICGMVDAVGDVSYLTISEFKPIKLER